MASPDNVAYTLVRIFNNQYILIPSLCRASLLFRYLSDTGITRLQPRLAPRKSIQCDIILSNSPYSSPWFSGENQGEFKSCLLWKRIYTRFEGVSLTILRMHMLNWYQAYDKVIVRELRKPGWRQ